jgi:hypothetical protein
MNDIHMRHRTTAIDGLGRNNLSGEIGTGLPVTASRDGKPAFPELSLSVKGDFCLKVMVQPLRQSGRPITPADAELLTQTTIGQTLPRGFRPALRKYALWKA